MFAMEYGIFAAMPLSRLYSMTLQHTATHVAGTTPIGPNASGDALPYWQHEWLWVALSAAISLLVALATLYLGWQTRNLAKDTRDSVTEAQLGRVQDDRHHQETLMPVCQFIGTVEMVRENYEDDTEHFRTFHAYDGYIENSGPGVATLVQADVACGRTDDGSIIWQVFPIGTIAPSGGRRDFRAAVMVYDSKNPPAKQLLSYVLQIGYHNFLKQRGMALQGQGFINGTKMVANNATLEHPPILDRVSPAKTA